MRVVLFVLAVLVICAVAINRIAGAPFDDASAPLIHSSTTSQAVTNCEIVTFDLETTGLQETDEVVQISAGNNKSIFNAYIIPSRPISDGAAAITGLKLSDGYLYLHDKKVQASSPNVAFEKFLKYLRTINNKNCIILVAHNGFRFDAPRLVKLAQKLGLLDQLKEFVKGFSDSLLIFKDILQDREKKKKRFSIKALARDFLPEKSTLNLHNAEYDVEVLQSLLNKIIKNYETIKISRKSVDEFLDK